MTPQIKPTPSLEGAQESLPQRKLAVMITWVVYYHQQSSLTPSSADLDRGMDDSLNSAVEGLEQIPVGFSPAEVKKYHGYGSAEEPNEGTTIVHFKRG
jgi:hypothetical protein